MVIVKLTEELLPYFLFLIDEIENSNKDIVISELLKECTDKEIETSWHSLSRAFTFRKILKEGIKSKQTYYVPLKKTLDALTKYCYGEDFIFRDLVKNSNGIDVSEIKVLEHYQGNTPKAVTITQIFEKKPEKIELVQEQLDACTHFLKELESCTLKQFIAKEIDERFNTLQKEVKKELDLKSELIQFLESKIDKLEGKKRQSNFIYRFFGSLGLFFVSINYDEVVKTGILEDFLDACYGLIDDDTIDELL